MALNLLAQPGGVDDDLLHAAGAQRLHPALQQRLAAHHQQRLGRVVGQRPHALAPAGGQDQRARVHGHSRGGGQPHALGAARAAVSSQAGAISGSGIRRTLADAGATAGVATGRVRPRWGGR